MPVRPMRENLAHKLVIARKPVRFGQSDKMLMTVEFPGNLRVSHFCEIEILYLEPGFAWSTLAMHHIRVPVDLRTIIEILVAQQVETMAANFFCLENDVVRLRRKDLLEQSA